MPSLFYTFTSWPFLFPFFLFLPHVSVFCPSPDTERRFLCLLFLSTFFDVSELPLAASAHPLQQAGCWVSHWAAVFSHAVFLYSLWMLSVGTWRLSVDEWVLWSRWDGNRDVIDIQSDPSEQLFGTNGLRHAHFLKAGLFSLTWPRVTAPSPEISSDLIYGVWIPAACYLGHRPMWCSMWGAQTKQQL